jgi:putative tricarboxylic transport membrane protein
MLLVLNLPLAPLWARVMLIPRSLLFGGILVLASVGAYGLNRSLLDVTLLYIVGVIGWGMRVVNVPLVPAVLGLILGPLAEQQFRRALAISQGDYTVFVSKPISAILLASAAAVLIVPRLLGRRAGAAAA